MNCPCNTTEPLPRLRAFRFGALAAAIVALSIAAPAGAETESVEEVGAPPAGEVPASSATTDTGAAAATPVPAAAAPEPVPVEVEAVQAAVEEAPSTAPEVPASATPVDRALQRSAATADSAVEVTTKAAEQASVNADALPASIRRPSELLDPVVKMSEEATAVAPGSTAEHPSEAAPKPARVGAALPGATIAPDLSPREPLIAKAAESKIEKLLPSAASAGEAVGPPAGNVANGVAPADTSFDNRAAGGHQTPSDLPPPAPESPASAVGGSGGTSFVPLAALLALLALAAPATLRRLGRAPDFQVPARFVCALERPG